LGGTINDQKTIKWLTNDTTGTRRTIMGHFSGMGSNAGNFAFHCNVANAQS